MSSITKALLILSTLTFAGCHPQVGVRDIPRSAPSDCQTQCAGMGMELGAIVTMAGRVGCVCQPEGTESDQEASASVSGGMAAIMLQQQQQQQAAQTSQTSSASSY